LERHSLWSETMYKLACCWRVQITDSAQVVLVRYATCLSIYLVNSARTDPIQFECGKQPKWVNGFGDRSRGVGRGRTESEDNGGRRAPPPPSPAEAASPSRAKVSAFLVFPSEPCPGWFAYLSPRRGEVCRRRMCPAPPPCSQPI
jgi:hypothetical protein